jgi:ABC-type multidrug transport system fused ATPase/permease subunit
MELVREYINNRKTLFSSYLVVSCLSYLVKVLLTSFVYSKLFSEGAEFKKIIKEICGVWVLICILHAIKSKIEASLIPDFLSHIRKKLFENYIKNNEVDFNDSDVSGDLGKILEVTRNIRDVFIWFTATFIPTVVLMICINLYFLVTHPSIGSITTIGNLINFKIISSCAPKLVKRANEREDEYLKMVGVLDENFNNLLNIYLNNKVADTIKDNEEIEEKYAHIYHQQNNELEVFSRNLKINNYFFAFLSMVMLYKTSKNHKDFVNGLLVFTFYLSTLENMSEDIPFSVMTLGNILNIEDALHRKNPNHTRITPFYNNKKSDTSDISNFSGHITFKDVFFRYSPKTDWILENFSLDIPAGDRIAIFSQSGFGKTTTMKILLGFYPIDKGEILLDGQNINKFDSKDVRSRINYINQRTLLFNDSIINNMKYGNSKSTDEILALLKTYDLLKIFCSDGSNCLDRMVEKNAVNISLGMQKVIFLVRGILKDNVNAYIFDEPLTSVDPATRKNILDMIDKQTAGKTLIIITHDSEVSRIVKRTVNLRDIQEK